MATANLNTLDNIGRAQLLIKRPDLGMEDTDVPVMDVGAAAAMADYVVGKHAGDVRGFFNPRGAVLTARALADRVPRKPATKSVGQCTFTRADTSTAESIPVGGVVVESVEDADGKIVQVSNTQVLNRAIGVATITVNVECLTEGPDGDVAAGAITRVKSGLPATEIVTNAAKLAGGNFEESDEALLARWKSRDLASQKGTPAALAFGALRVAGVAVVAVVVSASGLSTVYVADSSGNSNPTMVAAVRAELETGGDLAKGWASAGSAWVVVGASPVAQAISMVLSLRAGSAASATSLQPAIERACKARGDLLQPGEVLETEYAKAAAMSVDADILGVTLVVPSARVVPTASQKIVISTVAVA